MIQGNVASFTKLRTLSLLAAASAMPFFTSEAGAQRAAENVVTAAEDAFGASVGRETIGLYTPSSVRGFSPTVAGNARVDGLYFDQVFRMTERLRRTVSMRVGISAQGFPFPAPTGVIDYSFRKPGNEPLAGIIAGATTWGGGFLEMDAELPLGETLSLGIGGAILFDEADDGTDALYHNQALIAHWRPTDGVDLTPFWNRSYGSDDEANPTYTPAGSYLPPRIPRRRFDGPGWTDYKGAAVNYGVLASWAPDESWLLRLGAFRSLFDDEDTYANLYRALRPDGRAQQVIVADPPMKSASTSGELRITRSIAEGPRLHVFHLSARGRFRTRGYGGSDSINLGDVRVGSRAPVPRPNFSFDEQTRDRVEQVTAGLAYEGRWQGLGELSFGLSRTRYRKALNKPDLPLAVDRATPWLYNVAGAVTLTDRLAIYAGYTRGLEEGGVAPDSATNRNEPLRAILTRQFDAGLRWTIKKDLRLVAGIFDVRKPYFALDENNVFRLLGDVRHRGAEFSLAGPIARRLNLVAGAVLLDPEVIGDGVGLGRMGRRPVGQTRTLLRLNADWRPSVLKRISLDGGIVHTGPRTATRDNSVEVPARTIVDLGARYSFKLRNSEATLRAQVTNVGDVYGYDVLSSGSYDVIPGRLGTISLVIDLPLR